MPAVQSPGHRHRVYTSPGRIASLPHTGTLVPRPRVDQSPVGPPTPARARGVAEDRTLKILLTKQLEKHWKRLWEGTEELVKKDK